MTARVARWAALPLRIRNERYRPELPRDKRIFDRADVAGARFIERWGFRAGSSGPFSEGGVSPAAKPPD